MCKIQHIVSSWSACNYKVYPRLTLRPFLGYTKGRFMIAIMLQCTYDFYILNLKYLITQMIASGPTILGAVRAHIGTEFSGKLE